MSDFIVFKEAINKQFKKMSEGNLFRVNLDKDHLWNNYLDSFPEGTNKIYKERREYDCQCCKQFIRAGGNAVIINNGLLETIWDVEVPEPYQTVANALSKFVRSHPIDNQFLHYESDMGTDYNNQMLENNTVKRWDHFHYRLPSKFVNTDGTIDRILGNTLSNKEVFKRGLEEISVESIETVLELIDQGSLYRGEEHTTAITSFLKHKKFYNELINDKDKEHYCWTESLNIGNSSKLRNTVIGTLLIDLSEGKTLDFAVRAFEKKVAPENYKRPTALVTKSMIQNAQKKVEELGISDSLQRRYAVKDDITINNVLFANKDTKKSMNVFDELLKDAPSGKLGKVEEVSSETFINDILPSVEKIEVLFENGQENNLMSLIAPRILDAKPIFQWGNNFSWSYNGEVTDSMKERVKKAGGETDGVLRFSIQWNDGDNNQNDFDAHCFEPNGNKIYFGNKGQRHPSSGKLDVDIQHPGKKVAVENIIYIDKNKMPIGDYRFLVHNYYHNGGMTGFTAEIEYEGELFSFAYDKNIKQNEHVDVATVELTKGEKFKINKSLNSNHNTISKELWGIKTNSFYEVSMIMKSPNHWDGHKNGNSHLFFMLNDCNNDKVTRGFYNEFLDNSLTEHRKVFEVLGRKMKVEPSDNQLSGLGFSSTQRKSLTCKVSGSFTRTIKVNF